MDRFGMGLWALLACANPKRKNRKKEQINISMEGNLQNTEGKRARACASHTKPKWVLLKTAIHRKNTEEIFLETMLFSRFLFFSAKQRSIEAFNLLRRSGLPKRIHSRSYAKSSKSANGKTGIRPPMTVETPLTSRSRAAYVIPAAGVLFFAGLATFIHYNDERRVTLKGQGHSQCVNNLRGPIIGGPFTLADTENHTVTERNLLGNWVLLYFGYTSSPDVGPEQLQMMAKAINILESKHNLKVLPVFVSLDPERDTPSHLHAYLKEFESRIVGLTGPVSAIRQMAQEYRAYFKKVEEDGDDYLVECSHNMYFMNPNMEVVRCFGVEYNADELSEAIVKELKRTSTYNS